MRSLMTQQPPGSPNTTQSAPGGQCGEAPAKAMVSLPRRRADLIAQTSNHKSVARRAALIALARGAVAELPVQRREEYALHADNRFDLGIGGRSEAPAGSVLGALYLAGIVGAEILAHAAALRKLWRASLGGNGSGYPPHASLNEPIIYGCTIDCSPTSYDPRDADDPADDAAAWLESARAIVEP